MFDHNLPEDTTLDNASEAVVPQLPTRRRKLKFTHASTSVTKYAEWWVRNRSQYNYGKSLWRFGSESTEVAQRCQESGAICYFLWHGSKYHSIPQYRDRELLKAALIDFHERSPAFALMSASERAQVLKDAHERAYWVQIKPSKPKPLGWVNKNNQLHEEKMRQCQQVYEDHLASTGGHLGRNQLAKLAGVSPNTAAKYLKLKSKRMAA